MGIAPETIRQLWQELDSVGRAIMDYLMKHRSATIDELAAFTGLANHMEVLLAIRENINPQAERCVGFPILDFAEARYDPESGRKRCYSWWLSDAALTARIPDHLPQNDMDVFEDGESLTVLIDTGGLAQPDIATEEVPAGVLLRASQGQGSWQRVVHLSCPVAPSPSWTRFNNGILSLRFEKLLARS